MESKDPTLDERLHVLRTLPSRDIAELATQVIPEDKVPVAYLADLNEKDRILCLRASLICMEVTGRTEIPREMQLRVVVADQNRGDSLISAGTGSGKTLPIALNCLLDDPSTQPVTLTISPLKRLQSTQANVFSIKYNVPTCTINEDTPRDDAWWDENIFNMKTSTMGKYQHLLVTVEQLSKDSSGHFSRLGRIIRNKKYQKHIDRVNVDEVHHIRTAGEALYGLKAFRPAWGRVDEFKVLLPRGVRWHGFSAILPEHIMLLVQKKIMNPNFTLIRTTSNRPNTTYATHQIVNSIEDMRNYECFLAHPFSMAAQPHVLIFIDDQDLTLKMAKHLDSCLPVSLQGTGIVRHYHSGMSERFLSQAHEAFTLEEGNCRILVATSGQLVGIDFPNVKIVCTVGLPTTIVDGLQRGGRAIRQSNEDALFVIFYEHWVLDINLENYTGDPLDPDRPRTELRDNSHRRDRAPYSSVKLIQGKMCIRAFFSDYLNDKLPGAMSFTVAHCCERHPETEIKFSLQALLPGPLFTDISATNNKRKNDGSDQNPAPKKKYRAMKERAELDARLIQWLTQVQELDDGLLFRSQYDILSVSQRTTLVRTPIEDLKTPENITTLLGESDEWGSEFASKLFQLIHMYDASLPKKKTRSRRDAPAKK